MSKFSRTYCSQCGREFGPGDAGFSSCRQHDARVVTRTLRQLAQRIRYRTDRLTRYADKLGPALLAQEQHVIDTLQYEHDTRLARLHALGLTLAE